MRSIYFSFLFLQFFYACSNDAGSTSSENDADAARNFIRSALEGDYDNAKNYMIQDSLNIQYLDAFQRNYKNRMSRDDKRQYKEANITIYDVRTLNDSNTIVTYANTYKKKRDSLKIQKINHVWLVDLKYSFSNNDSLP
jgi:oligoribonuclease NrnB/cAMP/cGMP phosphodiesterase (DHH superfamily)